MATRKKTDTSRTAQSSLNQDTIRQTISDIAQEYDGNDDEKFTKSLARYASAIQAGYDAQREASGKQYDRNKSAAENAALKRGMGRSSYNLQTLANIDEDRAKAQQDIWNNQQSDLNQFAYQLGKDMQAQSNWQAEMDYQKERAGKADEQWQQQFDYQAGRDRTADEQWEKQFNTQNSQWQQTFDTQNSQWERQFNANQAQQQVQNQQWERQFNTSNEQWNRQFEANQNQQNIANQQWERQFNTTNNQWERQFATGNEQWNKEFAAQQEQNRIANEQWEKQFNFQVEQSKPKGSSGRGTGSKEKQVTNKILKGISKTHGTGEKTANQYTKNKK